MENELRNAKKKIGMRVKIKKSKRKIHHKNEVICDVRKKEKERKKKKTYE